MPTKLEFFEENNKKNAAPIVYCFHNKKDVMFTHSHQVEGRNVFSLGDISVYM